MTAKTIKVSVNLEARSAAQFVSLAGRFASNTTVQMENKTVNAKSIMGMISLGVLDGRTVTLAANGPDEAAALAELSAFLTAGG